MQAEHIALLRIHDACKGLLEEEINEIAEHVDVIEADSGELIYGADQELEHIYIVVEGRLKITFKAPDGTRRTIRYVSAGDQFGALEMITDEPIPVDVFVDEASTLFRLHQDEAESLADRFHGFRRNLWRKVGLGVRDAMIGKRRKRMVSKVVAFVNVDDQTRGLITEIATRLIRAGEKTGIVGDPVFRPTLHPDILFKPLIDSEDFDATLEQWVDLQRILLVVDPSISPAKLNRVFRISDQVFHLVTTDNFRNGVDTLDQLIKTTPSWKRKTHIVWALKNDEPVAPRVPALNELTFRDFKMPLNVAGKDERLFKQGVDRFVHYLRDVSIGLALSGGAAHGMTHLGVLKALEEAGITVDKMSGTSAGVLTGVVYAAGMEPDWAAGQFTHDLEPGSIYKKLPKGDDVYMLKKYRSHAWDKMLRKYLHDWRLEQLPLPISTVTTDLISARSIARTSGDAVHSILESINLPVLSPPICRDGMVLVDGGILNNLPADVLVNAGCNFVIGVDVAANIEHRVGDNTADTPDDQMKAPGVVTTLLRSLSVQAHNMSAVGASSADVIIAPDVSTFDAASFTRTPEMAEIGYQTTVESLPRIKEILCNLDNDLFCGVHNHAPHMLESNKATTS